MVSKKSSEFVCPHKSGKMRLILVLSLLSLSTLVKAHTNKALQLGIGSPWALYKEKFNKVYNLFEDATRYAIWLANVNAINAHNLAFSVGQASYSMKQSPLTDRTSAEMQRLRGLKVRAKSFRSTKSADDNSTLFKLGIPLPSSVDLSTSSCMPPIREQGNCGSCWAFAATLPIEFEKCMRSTSKQSLHLSEQQLVDCSSAQGNAGCNGGWYDSAWEHLKTNELVSIDNYPYTSGKTGVASSCAQKTSSNTKGTVISYKELQNLNETRIMEALASNKPVAVAICANCYGFMNYGSGVYMDPFCMFPCTLDHAVVLVGYGVTDGPLGIPYFLLRNSWGPSWGLNGYMKILRYFNQCRLGYLPSIVTVR